LSETHQHIQVKTVRQWYIICEISATYCDCSDSANGSRNVCCKKETL
jgi:hypothetical protein